MTSILRRILALTAVLVLAACAPAAAAIVFSGEDSLFVMNDDGSGMRFLGPQESCDNLNLPCGGRDPAVSPDGKNFVFSSDDVDSDAGGSDLSVMQTDGTHPKIVLHSNGQSSYMHPTFVNNQTIAFAYSTDGFLNPSIWTVSVSGTGLKQLTFPNPSQSDTSPVASPDGNEILFDRSEAVATGDHDLFDLFSIRPDGTGLTNITKTFGNGSTPTDGSFSPDGSKIVYTDNSYVDGLPYTDIREIGATGGTPTTIFSYYGGAITTATPSPKFSPSGNQIAYVAIDPAAGMDRIMLINADGSDAHAISPAQVDVGSFSWYTPLAQCVVPRLKGKSLRAARRLLHAAQCGLGKVNRPKHRPRGSGKRKLVVGRSSPRRGSVAPEGTNVRLRMVYKKAPK